MQTEKKQYSAVAKLLHWISAAAVITAVVLGFAMNSVDAGATQNRLYDLHRSFGALILLLTGGRLLWRLYSPPPPMPDLPAWQAKAATFVHRLLYVLLMALPLLGWAGTSAFPAKIMVFGLFELPPLVGPDRELSELLLEMHEVVALTLCALIAAHLAAALYHHLVRKDDTLKRMLP